MGYYGELPIGFSLSINSILNSIVKICKIVRQNSILSKNRKKTCSPGNQTCPVSTLKWGRGEGGITHRCDFSKKSEMLFKFFITFYSRLQLATLNFIIKVVKVVYKQTNKQTNKKQRKLPSVADWFHQP